MYYTPDYHTGRFDPGTPFFIEPSRKKRGGSGVLDYDYSCLYSEYLHRYGVCCIIESKKDASRRSFRFLVDARPLHPCLGMPRRLSIRGSACVPAAAGHLIARTRSRTLPTVCLLHNFAFWITSPSEFQIPK